MFILNRRDHRSFSIARLNKPSNIRTYQPEPPFNVCKPRKFLTQDNSTETKSPVISQENADSNLCSADPLSADLGDSRVSGALLRVVSGKEEGEGWKIRMSREGLSSRNG
ncbi:hypothetical protein CEXT_695451 [Caerostris extrusa]|uniref:Uncharacterized protein n=1 Tax=Caerostris extrusa TaxID=172846 RepID=A0AAV4R2Q2_CAEEX|nr:hypothetical protein CEXT_695451 [Caerostris extrusa]